MNLPNTLTVARIFLVPLLVVVLLTKFPAPELFGLPKELVAAAIFGLASLTDWLDGFLARRHGQITTLGQLLDPLADKLLITAALVSLVQMSLVPAWMAAVIIGRELAVTVLRSLAQSRGAIMPASSLGKLKMTAQIVAVLTLLVAEGLWRPLLPVGLAALWVSVAIAIVSAADYYRQFVQLTGQAQRAVRAAPGRLNH
jgi:CDP-diacylglycerol--glycerol-3-phosphate 3-phosphatidyltransferase